MSWRVLVLALLIPLVAHATPVGERLRQVIDAPLSVDPVRDNDAVGTTLVAAVGLENTKKSAGDTQLFVVTNLHASHNLCFGTVSAVGVTCDDATCYRNNTVVHDTGPYRSIYLRNAPGVISVDAYPAALSSGDRTALIDSLKTKWGIP